MSLPTYFASYSSLSPMTATLPAPAATSTPRWPVSILGVPVDSVTTEEALSRIVTMIQSGEPHYVVTPNVDFLVQAQRNPNLHRILCDADLVLCDGQPLVWASRWLGNPLPERVAGADLTPRLIAQAERMGHRIFLLGATPEANAGAVERLHDTHPGLVVAGAYAPPFRPLAEMDHETICERIRDARPDILFVSFGCPKQEEWIARHYRSLGVPVCLGVGAVIDFIAGRMNRAPVWMRRTGLEWTYRLGQEPRRLFHRYVTDVRYFIPALLAQVWAQRSRAHQAGSVEIMAVEPSCLHVRVTGIFDRALLDRNVALWRRIGEGDCRLDLRGVGHLDSTAAAAIVVWHRHLQRAGHRLQLIAPANQIGQAGLHHLQPDGPAIPLAA